jgi:hypothetical protein
MFWISDNIWLDDRDNKFHEPEAWSVKKDKDLIGNRMGFPVILFKFPASNLK